MTRTINPDGTLTMNLSLFEKLFGYMSSNDWNLPPGTAGMGTITWQSGIIPGGAYTAVGLGILGIYLILKK